jgi:hypothetical protein
MQKYGRTYHLPISPGASADDKVLRSVDGLIGTDLVITEKMDGENTTIHRHGTHARSPDSGYHASRDWLKAFAAGISPQLADGERIVGEYVFARHAVGYDALPSYFLGFAWILSGQFQSWDDTTARFSELSITAVPVLHRGPYRPRLFEDIAAALDLHKQEGFVVRAASTFHEAEMDRLLGKYVRAGHVQSAEHWSKLPITRNGLLSS